MIIEINTERRNSKEGSFCCGAGDSGSESPETRTLANTMASPVFRSRQNSAGTKEDLDLMDIFSPRYSPIDGGVDSEAKIFNLNEDKYAIFSPRHYPEEEPEIFPGTPLSEGTPALDPYSIFSPRSEPEEQREPCNPFTMFSPRYPKTTPKGATPTFLSLVANLESMKEKPFFNPSDSFGCQATFRSPRYSHVTAPDDFNTLDPPLHIGSGSLMLTPRRLIQAN